MLLAFVVLIQIIVYFLIFKKETFVKYDEKLLFGLDKSKDKLYQVNLRLSQLKHLEKIHTSLNKKEEIVDVKPKYTVLSMILLE